MKDMKIMIKIVFDNYSKFSGYIPSLKQLQNWCGKCQEANNQISIFLVDEQESHQLNMKYRKKDKPTNVLSFIESSIPGYPAQQLGTLVMCPSVISNEAKKANSDPVAHWAHLCVHGTLHLLGYDHEKDNDADIMERKEIFILDKLGFSNPYK